MVQGDASAATGTREGASQHVNSSRGRTEVAMGKGVGSRVEEGQPSIPVPACTLFWLGFGAGCRLICTVLHRCCASQVSHIRGHLQDLRARGLSRDPRAKPLPPPPTPPPTTQPAAATRKSPHNYQCTGSTSSTTNRQRGSWTDSPDCITQQCRRTGAEGWQQAG